MLCLRMTSRNGNSPLPVRWSSSADQHTWRDAHDLPSAAQSHAAFQYNGLYSSFFAIFLSIAICRKNSRFG